jgi:hypothetical protein
MVMRSNRFSPPLAYDHAVLTVAGRPSKHQAVGTLTPPPHREPFATPDALIQQSRQRSAACVGPHVDRDFSDRSASRRAAAQNATGSVIDTAPDAGIRLR